MCSHRTALRTRVLTPPGLAPPQEEARRAEIARLEAEARAEEARKMKEEEAKMQAKLASMGICPAGFAWHREGSGWRCNGGAHYVGSMPP